MCDKGVPRQALCWPAVCWSSPTRGPTSYTSMPWMPWTVQAVTLPAESTACLARCTSTLARAMLALPSTD